MAGKAIPAYNVIDMRAEAHIAGITGIGIRIQFVTFIYIT